MAHIEEEQKQLGYIKQEIKEEREDFIWRLEKEEQLEDGHKVSKKVTAVPKLLTFKTPNKLRRSEATVTNIHNYKVYAHKAQSRHDFAKHLVSIHNNK